MSEIEVSDGTMGMPERVFRRYVDERLDLLEEKITKLGQLLDMVQAEAKTKYIEKKFNVEINR